MGTEIERSLETKTVKFIRRADVPRDRKVAYIRIVVDIRPSKAVQERVRLTVGGDQVDYPGEVTTRTAELQTCKIHLNGVISTDGAKFMCLDIKNFYLGTPLDRPEYARIPAKYIPINIMDKYNLWDMVEDGHVYISIHKGMYGLPQAGRLANDLLRKRLAPYGYYECKHTPGYWKHVTRPIKFPLVVDDFGVHYEHREDVEHLMKVLGKWYEYTTDWSGETFCGITLKWNYDEGWVELSMPGYIEKVLIRFNHSRPKRPQHSPHPCPPPRFGRSQEPPPLDESPLLDDDGKKRIQQISGSVLFYSRAVDMTMLKGLNTISKKQAKPTELTKAWTDHLLDYCATHPHAVVRYWKSDMVLKIHSDTSFLNEDNARSSYGGYFFLGWHQKDSEDL